MTNRVPPIPQSSDNEWVAFPGGELEGKRPKVRCPECRTRLEHAALGRSLCFQCYRAALERERSLKAAGQLDTASEARFQWTLPFDAVNAHRLDAMKAVRTTERAAMRAGVGAYAERRRGAQIAARHTLQMLEAGLRNERSTAARERLSVTAVHAAELQLPESWLPFVVAR